MMKQRVSLRDIDRENNHKSLTCVWTNSYSCRQIMWVLTQYALSSRHYWVDANYNTSDQ